MSKTKHLYRLLILFFFLSIALIGCLDSGNGVPETGGGNGEGNGNVVSDGNVILDVEEIAGVGGVILYQGNEYYDQVEVPGDALVGIEKNGQGYLYHPAMGTNVDFSSESNKLAVGYFVLSYNSASENSYRSISSDEIELKTKVKVRQDNLTLTFKNNASRWAAVKVIDGGDEKEYFLLPVNKHFDSNLLRFLSNSSNIKEYGLGITDFFSSESTLSVTVSAEAKIETHGACIRGWPYFLGSGWPDGAREGYRSDPGLVGMLNSIDFNHTILEALKNFFGLIPYECVDLLTGGAFNFIEKTYFGALMGEKINDELFKIFKQDAVNSLVNCGLTKVTALTWEVANTFLDILFFVSWTVDNVVQTDNATINASAYDTYDLLVKKFLFEISIPGYYKGPFYKDYVGFGLGIFDSEKPGYPTIIAKTKMDDEWMLSDDLIITLSNKLAGPGIYTVASEDVLSGDTADILFHTREIMDEHVTYELPLDFSDTEGIITLESYGVNYNDKLKGTFDINIKGMQSKYDESSNKYTINPITGNIKGEFDGFITKTEQ